MVMLNRVLNGLILILGCVALAFGYLLFERRQELRLRGEYLADTVGDIVKDLDAQSGTTVQKDLNRKDYTGPNGEPRTGGSLGWAAFHDARDPTTKGYDSFKQMLQKAVKQARDVRNQRDALGVGFTDSMKIFGRQDLEPEAFQQVASYEESVKAVKDLLEAIRARDHAVISEIEALGVKINHPLEKDILHNLEAYEGPLKKFVEDVSKLHERAVTYADTIAQITTKIDKHDFEVNPDLLKDENAYAQELASLLNDFTNINEKLKEFEKNKIELLETKDSLEKTIESLEDANENVARLEDKLANLEADYATLNRRLEILTAGNTGDAGAGGDLRKLTGKIVDVNYDWNYVIINLGAKHNLPPKLEMIVAREKEFICKILVTTVYPEYAVAEILSDLKQGQVLEGDRVIF